MFKIKTIEELITVITDRVDELDSIKEEYLSESGRAAKEAYRDTLWHLSFHGSIESLRDDEDFKNLISTSDKHPEYHRILRMINRTIDRV